MDLALKKSRFDRSHDATALLDLLEVFFGLGFEAIGQGLDVVRTAEGIGHMADLGLFGDDLLGAQGDLDSLLGGQREGFVHGVRV